jgi:vacuolar protein sorting-associated protein 13A/C
MPAVGPDKRQLIIEYSVNTVKDTILLLNLSSPKIMLAPDYFMALSKLFIEAYGSSMMAQKVDKVDLRYTSPNELPVVVEGGKFTYRFTIADAEILLLLDAANQDTDGMIFSIDQFVLSQESILSMAVRKIGVSLCNMNNRESTCLRIMQAFDFTFFLDCRTDSTAVTSTISSTSDGTASIVVDIPDQVVFRVSYHDVMVVLAIVQKFSQIAGEAAASSKPARSLRSRSSAALSRAQSLVHKAEKQLPVGKEKVILFL